MRHSEAQPRAGGDGKIALNPERLKALRRERGLSQDGLAQLCLEHRLCVSIASIKRAETGKAVLYRTASHLARVYASELAWLTGAPHGEAGLPALPCAPAEVRTVLELMQVLPVALPAGLAAQAAALIAQFGGLQERPGLAIFGHPRAYDSDAVRCVQCALGLARLLAGHCTALVIGSRAWPLDHGASGASARLLALLSAEHAGAAPAVYLTRDLGMAPDPRFVFLPSGHAELLRFSHERHEPLVERYPFIGRHVELHQFKAVLETTLAYQNGHILYLRGVAGIGKSRLIQEFAGIGADSGVAVHRAVVLDFGVGDEDAPLAQLVRSLLAAPPAELPSEPWLASQLQLHQLGEEQAMPLRAVLGMPQPAAAATVYAAMAHDVRQRRQTEAIRQLILHSSLRQPLLMVLEDLHWSSPELLATLGALLPDVHEAPIIWLLSSRIEQDPMELSLRTQVTGLPVSMLDLATLRTADALAMAHYADDADPHFHQQCVARAQGNPLFLTQLLLGGRSQGLPASLRNLVQSKLDLLPAAQRRGIRVASAIGQYVALPFLRAVLGEPEHALDACVALYIVRPAERGNYVFVHDLVMQGIYESIPAPQRAEIHLAIAGQHWPQERALHAQHLHKAGSADAPALLVAAAEERIASYQYAGALELLAICQRIDYAPCDAYRLQLLSGRCHAKMGQTQRAKLAYSEALGLAADLAQRIAAVTGLAAALNVLEEMAAEEALLDRTLAAAAAAPEVDGVAELYYLKGNMYFPLGNFARSRELHELAQRHARSKDTQARALSGIGDSYYAEGKMVSAHRVFQECLALCREHGLADVEASNRFMLGTTRLYLNQTAGALEDAAASAELALRVGNRRAEIVSRLTAGWALLSLERSAEARLQVEQGLEVARLIGASRFEPFLNESMARVLLAEGQGEQARTVAAQAWDNVQRNKLHKFIGPWVLSTLALTETDAQARRAALAQGQALIEQGCVAHNLYRYYVSAMECALLDGDAGGALAASLRFEHAIGSEPCPWATHHIALARAGAGWLESRTGPAGAGLRELARHGQQAGLAGVMPVWRHRLGAVPAPD